MSLAEWARSCYHNGTLDEIMDKHLKGRIAPECLRKYGEIAVNCLVDNGSERPSMNDVVWGLEFALKLQRSAEENTSLNGELTSEIKGKDERPFFNYSEDEGKFSCSWEHTSELKSGETKTSSSEHSRETNQSIKGMSGAVFSEINNPQAR
ncbi:hypothetical protein FEM48_Zijuj04G0056500 [Ziziphus jujuba var. spinosa]|nr:hypothetical protein FEM48_Zijuj04G0056500 [Ziziphus jujuba var. spinosa]